MIAFRLVVIFPLFTALVLLHALPLMPKRSRLFGVDVPPEIRYGREGSRLMRRYQLWLLPFTIAAFLLITFWTSSPVLVVAGLAAACFAAVGLQLGCHASAIRFALPTPSIREASLNGEVSGLARRLLWFAPPLLVLAATALYLRTNWDRIPETFPVHFDLNGKANDWSHRTFWGVFGPSMLGAYIIVFLMALYIMMDLGSRRATRRSVMLAGLAAPSYLIGAMFSLVGFLPFFNPPAWVFLILVGGFFAIYVLLMAHVLAKPLDFPPEATPDRCWHGVFYYNPDDPALFVEARTGFGYAGNFARPLSWVLGALMLLFPLGLLVLIRKFGS
jgi:uncharacterized membrane protein